LVPVPFLVIQSDNTKVVRPGQEWAAGDCGPGAQGQGAKDGCGLLSGWALRLFRGKSLEEILEISFEIGMLGRHGLDINDPNRVYSL